MTDPTAHSPSIRAVLYLRHRASPDTVQRLRELAERVRRLEADGIAEAAVETWSCVTPAVEELGDSGPSVSRTVKAFRTWASDEGYALEPGFDRRETTSISGSRSAVRIRVPIACLAVYEGEELRCIAPCSNGGRTYSVEQCLVALEAGLTEPFAFHDRLDSAHENSTENDP